MPARVKLPSWLPLLAGALVAGACSSNSPGMGTLSVKLTDAPLPLDSVARADVYVVRVAVHPAGTTADTTAADSSEADSGQGWITVATPNMAFNLLELQNGTTVDLGGTSLPTGSYGMVRLVLNTDSSSVTLKDGTVLTASSSPSIMWPSAGQSGIKVILDKPIEVTAGGTVMVVDFDLGQSFIVRGRTIMQNGLLFKPVVKASAQGT